MYTTTRFQGGDKEWRTGGQRIDGDEGMCNVCVSYKVKPQSWERVLPFFKVLL